MLCYAILRCGAVTHLQSRHLATNESFNSFNRSYCTRPSSYYNELQNDLVKRMRNVVEHLSDDAVEPDSPDYPGLAGLAAVLVEDRYLKHKDKEVRLHTVLACVEIFYMVSTLRVLQLINA